MRFTLNVARLWHNILQYRYSQIGVTKLLDYLCPALLSVFPADTGVVEVLYENQGREHEGALICRGSCPLLFPGHLA